MTRRTLPVVRAAEEVLPRYQSRWITDLLAGPLPHEVNATCDDCAMLSDDARAVAFLPETRCCTFTPSLANFLVGAALREGGASGATVRARLATGEELSPLGLTADPARVAASTDPARFGRDPAAVCPHFVREGGRCGIWAWREATCATWFCKHVRGEVAKGFWNRLQQLVQRVERAVAWHCAVELGVPAEGLARLAPLDAPRAQRADVVPADLDDPTRLWGRWARDVEGYLVACAGVADGLDGEAALALAGSEARALRAAVALGRARMDDDALPPRLGLGRAQVVALAAGTVRVQGYSHLDPLDLPRALFDVLHHFDGRATGRALREASEAAGEEVPEGAVRMLVDFGILRAV